MALAALVGCLAIAAAAVVVLVNPLGA